MCYCDYYTACKLNIASLVQTMCILKNLFILNVQIIVLFDLVVGTSARARIDEFSAISQQLKKWKSFLQEKCHKFTSHHF